MPRIAVCKTFTFHSAHTLAEHKGKCKNLHGHTYKLEVEVSSRDLEPSGSSKGMVLDFGDLKTIVQDEILSKVDHVNLNDLEEDFYSTAENLVNWIWGRLFALLTAKYGRANLRLDRVRLWETEDSWAERKYH